MRYSPYLLMNNIVKCRWSHCNHDIREINKEEAIKDGGYYYHKDCYTEKKSIGEVRTLFLEKIDNQPVMSQLNNTINNIVFNKHVSAEYLLFGLRYYIDHKIPLRYPAGLHYVVQSNDVQKAWDLKKSKEISRIISIEEDSNLSQTITYKPHKRKSIGDIFDE